jgi:hypothetical protein
MPCRWRASVNGKAKRHSSARRRKCSMLKFSSFPIGPPPFFSPIENARLYLIFVAAQADLPPPENATKVAVTPLLLCLPFADLRSADAAKRKGPPSGGPAPLQNPSAPAMLAAPVSRPVRTCSCESATGCCSIRIRGAIGDLGHARHAATTSFRFEALAGQPPQNTSPRAQAGLLRVNCIIPEFSPEIASRRLQTLSRTTNACQTARL